MLNSVVDSLSEYQFEQKAEVGLPSHYQVDQQSQVDSLSGYWVDLESQVDYIFGYQLNQVDSPSEYRDDQQCVVICTQFA